MFGVTMAGQVVFPPKLSIWSSAEGPEVVATRRPLLQEWINKMIFLNNTLVASGVQASLDHIRPTVYPH